MSITYHSDEKLSVEEYVEFLKRTDLGSMYPKKNFEERIAKLLANRSVSITARNEVGLLIGICFGLTDFCYFLFLTDMGIDRDHVRQGIGKKMLAMLVDAAGGPDDICLATVADDNAIGFYESFGMKSEPCVLWKECLDWKPYKVS